MQELADALARIIELEEEVAGLGERLGEPEPRNQPLPATGAAALPICS